MPSVCSYFSYSSSPFCLGLCGMRGTCLTPIFQDFLSGVLSKNSCQSFLGVEGSKVRKNLCHHLASLSIVTLRLSSVVANSCSLKVNLSFKVTWRVKSKKSKNLWLIQCNYKAVGHNPFGHIPSENLIKRMKPRKQKVDERNTAFESTGPFLRRELLNSFVKNWGFYSAQEFSVL